jgi:hypothetical protein
MSAETSTRWRRRLQWPLDWVVLTLAHEERLPWIVVRILVGC